MIFSSLAIEEGGGGKQKKKKENKNTRVVTTAGANEINIYDVSSQQIQKKMRTFFMAEQSRGR